MQARMLSLFFAAVLAIPTSVRAQFLFQETLEPRVDASQEQWQIYGEPLLLDGLIYYQSGPTRFFDGNVMVRTGVYRGIPVYQDRTIEPYSIVYVPIGGRMMRPYERRRSFPISSPAASEEWNVASPPNAVGTAGVVAPATSQAPGNTYVKTAGVVITNASVPSPAGGAPAGSARPRMESIPGPSGPEGIYIEFQGTRWFNSGPPRPYSADVFAQVGDYAGFAVYRMRGDAQERVWVPVVDGGPLAQYSKR